MHSTVANSKSLRDGIKILGSSRISEESLFYCANLKTANG